MKIISFAIPDNWKPNDHKFISKWLEKLPVPQDLNKAIEIQENYESKRPI